MRKLIARKITAATLAIVFTATATPALSDKTATVTIRSLDLRGVQLVVETQGSGAPIVFLHGGVSYFGNSYAKQRDYFAAFRQVIGIDQRGHGRSSDVDRPFSYQEMADDTAAVIEQLGVGRVDVVGHSDGGNVGLLLARYHPTLVRRLVISGANLRASLPAEELERRKSWTPPQIAEKVRKLSDSLPPNFRTDYLRVTPMGPDYWWTFLAKSYQLWLTPVVIETAELKAIKIPVMVMAGDHDFTPIDETLEIYRGLPQGQLFVLPDTGHGTMTDRPELVNLAIRQFLERPERDKAAH